MANIAFLARIALHRAVGKIHPAHAVLRHKQRKIVGKHTFALICPIKIHLKPIITFQHHWLIIGSKEKLCLADKFFRHALCRAACQAALAQLHASPFQPPMRPLKRQRAAVSAIHTFVRTHRHSRFLAVKKQSFQRFLAVRRNLRQKTRHRSGNCWQFCIQRNAVLRKHLKNGALLRRCHGIFLPLAEIQHAERKVQQYQQNNNKFFCIPPFHARPPFAKKSEIRSI